MPGSGPEYPLTHRRELVASFFDLLAGGESGAIIGPASMGKSRLLRHLQHPEVQSHFLGSVSETTCLVIADCNRLAEVSEWGLYELLLTALTETAAGRIAPAVRDFLNDLRHKVITERNALLARRHVELASRVLCREHGLRLCFIFDEFDTAYRSLPASALANLRALRDADRYSVCYFLMMRDRPERLRNPADCEGFYELISRSILGLKPYVPADAQDVITYHAVRRSFPVNEEQRDDLLFLSGGHPGLLVALLDVLIRGGERPQGTDPTKWALAQPQLVEECRKLWGGLAQDEQLALSRLAQGIGASYAIRELLALKGLILPNGSETARFFSPVFREYVLTQGVLSERTLWLDEPAVAVWVEGKRIADLSPLEFELLRLLNRHLGQVCTRDDIMAALYPNEMDDGSDNRLDSLVRHLRKAIEPTAGTPRYLLTARGLGYKLVDTPTATT
jgi:hypothetical protein